MSHFSAAHKRYVPAGGGGGGSSVITYDASIGNGVDTNGFADLPLRPTTAKRIYLNSSTGLDANNGLSAAAPVATYDHAMSLVTFGVGDQLLIAEGTTYASSLIDSSHRLNFIGSVGFSLLYPFVIQSYAPSDPTNEAKIGRASGSNRPVFTGAWTGNWFQGGTQQSFIAVRGLDINPGNITDQGIGMQNPGSGILFENCIVRYTGINFNAQFDSQKHWIIRNCALYGSFSTTVSTGGQLVYADGCDSVTIEDCVLWHGGWKVGAARTDDWTLGGSSIFKHPFYQQDPSNAIVRRCFIVDGSADGGSHRGGVICDSNVYMDNPINPGAGGGVGYDAARPTGIDIQITNNVTVGSSSVTGGTNDEGEHFANGRVGSAFARYNLWARSASGNGHALVGDAANFNNLSNFSAGYNVAYQWSASGQTVILGGGPYNGQIRYTDEGHWIWDDPTAGTNTNIGSVSFPNAYTGDTLGAALGHTDKATLIAYAVANPEAHIQRQARSLLATGYAVPQASGLQPLATYSKFVIGTSDFGFITGVQDGSTLSISGFPTGFTISSSIREWFYDGTGSGNSSGTGVITETASDGTTTRTTNVSWTLNVAPLLTSATATATGTTTATIGITTNVGNGTLYWAVYTLGPQPAWPQWGYVKTGIVAGTVPFTQSGNQAISTTGAKTASVTGLTTGTTYHAYFVHIDASGNQSIVGHAGPFTTS